MTDMSEKIGHRDALYLFACHLEWLTERNLAAYQELLAALDDPDGDIRRLAEYLLHRSSPRPERVRQVSNPGEEHPFGVEKRVASYLQFCGQAQNGKTGAELKGAISLGKCES